MYDEKNRFIFDLAESVSIYEACLYLVGDNIYEDKLFPNLKQLLIVYDPAFIDSKIREYIEISDVHQFEDKFTNISLMEFMIICQVLKLNKFVQENMLFRTQILNKLKGYNSNIKSLEFTGENNVYFSPTFDALNFKLQYLEV